MTVKADMNKLLSLLLLTLVVLASACGGGDDDSASSDTDSVESTNLDTTNPPTTVAPVASETIEPGDIVFVWTETGGCAMAGPNCARYEITADGSVTTYREGGEAAPAATGNIDAATVQAWIDTASATDVEAMVGRLGPGEMTAAFDGVDYTLASPVDDLDLSSVDVEFDQNEPLFAAAVTLARAAAEAAPLEIEFR